MTIHLTADQHFGHENIIKYCERPFSNIDEMDNAIVNNWNSVVYCFDTVFCLSDVTFGGMPYFKEYMARLNGTIIILGNAWHHDGRWIEQVKLWRIENAIPLSIGSQKMKAITDVRTATGERVYLAPPMAVIETSDYRIGSHKTLVATLSHFPLAVWPRKHYGAVHFHGHSHGTYKAEGRILDVGVDNQKFTPLSLADGIKHMRGIYVEEAPIKKKRKNP